MNVIVRTLGTPDAVTTTLAKFFLDNIDGISDDEAEAIRAKLERGEVYQSGGGAVPAWTIERAEP